MKKYASQYERMTQQPIPSLVIQLGIPTTISMLVTSFYNLVDTYFVGLLKSTEATGAVGVVFSFMAILQAVGFMFGQGSGSIISRLLGSRKTEEASKIASTGFFSAVFVGLFILIFGFLTIDHMVFWLGSSATIAPYAKEYLGNLLWAAPFVCSSFVLNNILRYEGKANLAMVGLLCGAGINMAADPLFMFGLHMGVAGAAMATAVAQTISFCVLLSMFLRGKTESHLSIRRYTKSPRDLWEICATGFPSLVRQGMGSVSTMMLNHLAKGISDAAVAAMSIVSRINMFIFSTGLGIGQGFQPVAGFNYGAKKYGRVREAFFFTLKVAMVMLGVFATLGLVMSEQAIGWFRDDPAVIEIGTLALRFQCIALYIIPIQVLSNMVLQSTGQKAAATFTSMLRSGLYYVPILGILWWFLGLLGIQMAQMVADFLSVATCVPIVGSFLQRLKHMENETR